MPATAEPTTTETIDPVAIDLEEVTFARQGREILHGVSLTIRRGELWALLGPNGAGKSTILGFCGAQTHPTSGLVHVLGERIGRTELAALRRRIGHVDPRHPLRSPLTARQVVLTGLTGSVEMRMRWEPTRAQVRRAEELLDLLGLGDRAERTWPVLSQGERGRVLLARALVADPELLLLDEPSTGLDVAAREQLLTTVDLLDRTHPGLATVLVTHHLEELPTSTTHAALVAGGRIVAAGPAREVITSEHVSAAFDHPIEVTYTDGRWGARAGRSLAVV